MIKIYKSLPNNIRKTTYDQIQKLFEKFTYKYDFKREDIEEMFQVKKSRASEIIALLLEEGLITPPHLIQQNINLKNNYILRTYLNSNKFFFLLPIYINKHTLYKE